MMVSRILQKATIVSISEKATMMVSRISLEATIMVSRILLEATTMVSTVSMKATVRYHCGEWSEELNSHILLLAYMVYL